MKTVKIPDGLHTEAKILVASNPGWTIEGMVAAAVADHLAELRRKAAKRSARLLAAMQKE